MYATTTRIGVKPGEAARVAAMLIRRSDALAAAGCRVYEVGADPLDPDAVFVVELWDSEEAHGAALELPDVRDAIAAALPFLSGENAAHGFDVVGSPLRDA
jgi:quinol monooxygenase YgiN